MVRVGVWMDWLEREIEGGRESGGADSRAS